MKRFAVILLMSILVFSVGCGKEAAPALSLTGKITNTEKVSQKKIISAVGLLSWLGETEKDNSNLTIPLDGSTDITDTKGKKIKMEDLKADDKIVVTFGAGTKIVPPAPGVTSSAAKTIRVEKN